MVKAIEKVKEVSVTDRLTLADLERGVPAEIVKVGAKGEIKRRLLEMGVVRGGRVVVERVAPLGDPIEVRIMGYRLSLRHTEAVTITVRRLDS
jgi:Fe2+ transport system protein FeoA